MKCHSHLSDYLEELRKQGRYLFSKEEAILALQGSENASKSSLKRLSQRGKVAYLKKGLYQIIPEEYAFKGSLPPEWFINDLRKHLNVPYYVGLLSAAALHGAAHQAPQIFQVICGKQLRDLNKINNLSNS